jgi:hypothetical protein
MSDANRPVPINKTCLMIFMFTMRLVAEMRGRPGAPADLILRQHRLAVGEDAKPGELFQRTKIKTAAK